MHETVQPTATPRRNHEPGRGIRWYFVSETKLTDSYKKCQMSGLFVVSDGPVCEIHHINPSVLYKRWLKK
ncbi:hypothetical protein J2W49_003463 [Hydrogenophaga palleronii]|uniref:HNH endonuclease n=1 Tax=Hydrogenophaga palleronii TaxID=65655 RepID=A0ABU1WRF3_9BURK|nr:hypothetical protein [Hydrogenophaga palleronii]